MRRVMLLSLLALALPTAALATSITVNIPVDNPSFQILPAGGLPESCGPGCHFSRAPIPGWSGGDGQLIPSVGHDGIFHSFAPRDGRVSAYSNGGTISQQVGPTVKDGVIYTLTVELGHRNDTPFEASADLLVGGQTFSATGTAPRRGHWSTFTATFTGTAGEVGDPITIQLNSGGVQGNFDSVKLTETTTTVIPEPGTLGMLGTGLIGLAGMTRRKFKLWT